MLRNNVPLHVRSFNFLREREILSISIPQMPRLHGVAAVSGRKIAIHTSERMNEGAFTSERSERGCAHEWMKWTRVYGNLRLIMAATSCYQGCEGLKKSKSISPVGNLKLLTCTGFYGRQSIRGHLSPPPTVTHKCLIAHRHACTHACTKSCMNARSRAWTLARTHACHLQLI